jgi:hypothetical protein
MPAYLLRCSANERLRIKDFLKFLMNHFKIIIIHYSLDQIIVSTFSFHNGRSLLRKNTNLLMTLLKSLAKNAFKKSQFLPEETLDTL